MASLTYTIAVSTGTAFTDIYAAVVVAGANGTPQTTQIRTDRILEWNDEVLIANGTGSLRSTFIARPHFGGSAQSNAKTLEWLPEPDVVPAALSVISVPTQVLAYQTPSTGNVVTSTSTPISNTPTSISPSNTALPPGTGPSPSPSTSPSPRPTTGGLSKGAKAGIAVGCLLLVTLTAFLVYLFFLRRRGRLSQSISRRDLIPSRSRGMGECKAPAASITPVFAAFTNSSADDHIPQPAEDNELIQEFRLLKTTITGHVQTYYDFDAGANIGVQRAIKAALCNGPDILEARISTMMTSPRSRALLARAALGCVIVQRVLPSSDGPDSFLPPDILAHLADLRQSTADEATRSAVIVQWRTRTAACSTDTYGRPTLEANDKRMESIQVAVRQANTFLGPFAQDRAADKARLRNLEEIMKRGARVAWLFFAQPSGFVADWSGERDLLVVYPGLVQETDKHGRRLVQPRTLGNIKEVVRA